MYADDAILISQTRIRLQRALKIFLKQCDEELLTINYSKTKIIYFNRVHKTYNWKIHEQNIEQEKSFKYLGVIFTYNGS